MARTVLQIPMDKALRVSAESAAVEQGFSSLQDAVRMILHKLADKSIGFSIEPYETLSPKAEKRYTKMIDDIKKGKNVTKTKNLDELFSYLE